MLLVLLSLAALQEVGTFQGPLEPQIEGPLYPSAVAAALHGDRVIRTELVDENPSKSGVIGSPELRTTAIDASGLTLWTNSTGVDASGLADAPEFAASQPISDALGMTFRCYLDGGDEPRAVWEALSLVDGQTIWTRSLPTDRLSFESPFQLDPSGTLLLTVLGAVGDLVALDASTGAVRWSAGLEQDIDFVPSLFNFKLGAALAVGDEYAAVAQTQLTIFDSVYVHRVRLSDGSRTLLTDQLNGEHVGICLSGDQSAVALAIGRNPSVRIHSLDAVSGATHWVQSSDNQDCYFDPVIRAAEGQAAFLASFRRKGTEAFGPPLAASHFISVAESNGAIQWSETVAAASGEPLPNQDLRSFLEPLSSTEHLRSFPTILPGPTAAQRLERIRNSDGAVLASTSLSGPTGLFHAAELGVDPQGRLRSVQFLQDGAGLPIDSLPTFALGSVPLTLNAAEYTKVPIEPAGLVDFDIAHAASSSDGRWSALLARRLSSVGTTLLVVDRDALEVVWSTSVTDFKSFNQANALEFSPTNDRLVLRMLSPGPGSESELLSCFDVTSGAQLWSIEQPTAYLSDPATQDSVCITTDLVCVNRYQGTDVPAVLTAHELGSGAVRWTSQIDGAGPAVATEAVACYGANLYASRIEQVSGFGPPQLQLTSLDPLDGAVISSFGFPANTFINGIVASEDAVAVQLQGTDPLGEPSGAWVIEADLSALRESRADYPAGLLALARGDGFIGYGNNFMYQIGDLAGPGEPTAGQWYAGGLQGSQTGLYLPHVVRAVDGGDLLVRARQNVWDYELEAFDAHTGESLFTELEPVPGVDFAGFGASFRLQGSPDAEISYWSQAESLSDEGASRGLYTIALPELFVLPDELSLAAGGTADLKLRGALADAAYADPLYVLMGGNASLSGIIDLGGGFSLPFSGADPFLPATLLPAPGTFDQFQGALDHAGQASASVTIPAGLDPNLAGAAFDFLWVQLELLPDGQGGLAYAITHVSDTSRLSLNP